ARGRRARAKGGAGVGGPRAEGARRLPEGGPTPDLRGPRPDRRDRERGERQAARGGPGPRRPAVALDAAVPGVAGAARASPRAGGTDRRADVRDVRGGRMAAGRGGRRRAALE